MNLFKNMADQETAQYNSTTPITCLILCWLLINNNMKSQRPNTAHVFGIRVFNSPICPICFLVQTRLCWKWAHLIVHSLHNSPFVEQGNPTLPFFQPPHFDPPPTPSYGSWNITHTYHRPYTYMCIHVLSRTLSRLTLHAYGCISIHMKCSCMQLHPYAYTLKTHSMNSIHLHTWAWRCMHTRVCACMCM